MKLSERLPSFVGLVRPDLIRHAEDETKSSGSRPTS